MDKREYSRVLDGRKVLIVQHRIGYQGHVVIGSATSEGMGDLIVKALNEAGERGATLEAADADKR